MKKRILSIFLAALMVVSLLPVTAFAETDYFTITNASEQDAEVTWKKTGTPTDINLQYSIDGGDWTSITPTGGGTQFSLPAGKSVKFINNSNTFSTSSSDYYSVTCDKPHTVSGNVMTLLDGKGEATSVPSYAFTYLFTDDTNLTSAKDLKLPAMTLANYCYMYMFNNCKALVDAPALPAKTLKEQCYKGMFQGCKSLKNAPALPATSLATSCYYTMFNGCEALVNAPALPATTLKDSCYYQMFQGCTSLVNAPALSAKTLVNYCYRQMFSGCTALNSLTVGFSAFNPTNATQSWLNKVPTSCVVIVPDNFNKSYTAGSNTIPEGIKVVKASDVHTITNDRPQTAAETNNGYLTVDKEKGLNEDLVTVIVSPNEGYELKANSLLVKYNNGSADQTITPTKDEQDTTKYTFTMPNYSVTVTAEFEKIPAHTHGSGESAVTFTAIKTFADLQDLFSKGGSGYLAANIDCTAALTVAEGKTVNLCLNDKVLDLKKLGNIMVSEDAEFNLHDCGEGTTRYYSKGDNGLWTLVAAQKDATEGCSTTGGIITGGATGGGGCVYVAGLFTMNGGNLYGNTAFANAHSDGHGGGVYVAESGSFTMNDGGIGGNRANCSGAGQGYGGGVYAAGLFTMNGGTVCDNMAVCGGGVSVIGNGSFTMNDGTICGNSAYDNDPTGGGVCLDGGSFTMNDGTICDNTADYGGGLYSFFMPEDWEEILTITLLGGTICDNTAVQECGGVGALGNVEFALGGTVVIKGNTAYGQPSDLCAEASIDATTKPQEGMEVGLGNTDIVVTNASEGDEQYFFADNPEKKPVYDNGSIKLVDRPAWYIDENGEEVELEDGKFANAVSGMTEFNGTPVYVKGGKVTISGAVTMTADTVLILADGAELEITGNIASNRKTLTVYAQTNGTGKLTVTNIGTSVKGIEVKKLVLTGGNIEVNSTEAGIRADVVTVLGGTLTANSTGYTGILMDADGLIVSGGTVNGSGATGLVGPVTVSGTGVVNLHGGTLVYNGNDKYVKATVQVSNDGSEYADWGGYNPADERTLGKYKYLKLTAAHTHSFTYEADGATVTATCTADGCKLPDKKLTLTLTDDLAANAAAVKAWNDAGAAAATLSYYAASDTEFATPLDTLVTSGKYVVKATASDKTASLEFDYESPYWYLDPDPETGKVELETLPDVIVENKTADVNWSGWVFVPAGDPLKIDAVVTLTDDVNIILADGASLEITEGITSSSKTLTVYAQTNGTGKLTATETVGSGSAEAYGLKGNLTVNGGVVNISGTCTLTYSGFGVNGNVTVNGGSVDITGAAKNSDSPGYGVYGSVTVSGGNVTISGTSNSRNSVGVSGSVEVSGGDVTISGTGNGLNSFGVSGSVTVSGGDVTISGTGGSYGCGVYSFDTITVSGDGVLTVNGSTLATNLAKENINATVQTSTDGMTYADWNEETALNTYKYLKLTAAHTHSFTYSASGATLTATCTGTVGTCKLTDKKVTLTLTAADAFYDGAAYDGASTDDTTVKFAETTGASIGNLTYYSLTETEEGGQKKTVETLINGAPANAGSYKVKVTVTYDTDKTVTAEKAFTINPRPVTLVAGSAEKVYDGDPLTCVTYSIEADTTTAGYGFVGEEGLAFVTMTEASTITNVGSTDNVINTKTAKEGTNLANYTVTTEKGTLTVKPLAETAPEANEGYTLDFIAETLKAKTGYEVSSTNGDTATALTNDKVTPDSTAQTFYVRRKASDTNHAPSAWTPITVPAYPAAPAAPTLDSVTAATVVVTAVAGQVYSIDGGTNWLTGTDGKVTFSGLTAVSAYSIITRKAAVTTGGSEAFASANSTALTGYTAAETPANVAATGTVSYSEETFTLTDGYEISETDAPSFSAMQPDTNKKVVLQPGKTYYVRKAAVTTPNAIPASEAIELVIPARPTAPAETAFTITAETVENKKDGTFDGITEEMEYKKGDGDWTSGPAALNGLSNETIKVRFKATTEAFKSEEYSYTFTPSTAKLTVTANGTTYAEVAYGDKLKKPADPEKSGYTFGGWYRDEELTQAWNFGTDTVTGNMTLYPKWIRNNVQKAAITGNVTEVGTGAVSGATVELYLGTVKVAATVTKTDPAGDYSFDNVENGVYNIVVTTADGKTKTELVTVDTANNFTKNVELPNKAVSSVVEVEDTQISDAKSDVSKTVVGGLDEIAKKHEPQNDGDKVTIKLTVEPKADTNTQEQQAIKNEAGNGKKVEFLDVSLLSQVNAEEPTDIGDSNTQLLTIVIPFDFNNVDVSSVMILRKHGTGNAEKLAKNPASGQEGFTVDQQAGTITIYAMKFSDYALAYAEKSSGGGGGASSYAVTVESAKNGTVSTDKKTASAGSTVTITVTPDKGFTLETLTVLDKNGKEVEVKNLGNNKYSFKMPTGKVSISATFMEDNSMLNFFVDVKATDYYYDAVLWAAENDITKGTDAVHFSPNAPVTRAQVVTFLWRAAGKPVVNYAMSFADVSGDAYYTEAVRWAVAEGITKGTSDTTFSPDKVCTRGQIVTFLARFAGVKDEDASGYSHGFTDVKATDYYNNAVAWAKDNKVTEGTSATTFSPNTDCTRAQVVTFLYRWMVK